MTAARSEPIAGTFVVCRVGQHRFAVDASDVDEVLAEHGAGGAPATDAEKLLGIPMTEGARMWLCMSRGDVHAELSVPRAAIEVGRHLTGRCQSPSLIAALLERRCLKGVVIEGDQLIYLMDLVRFWQRHAVSPSEGESP